MSRNNVISVRVDQAEYDILVKGWLATGCRGLSTFIREEALTGAKQYGFAITSGERRQLERLELSHNRLIASTTRLWLDIGNCAPEVADSRLSDIIDELSALFWEFKSFMGSVNHHRNKTAGAFIYPPSAP